jgi:hypothetical protein
MICANSFSTEYSIPPNIRVLMLAYAAGFAGTGSKFWLFWSIHTLPKPSREGNLRVRQSELHDFFICPFAPVFLKWIRPARLKRAARFDPFLTRTLQGFSTFAGDAARHHLSNDSA